MSTRFDICTLQDFKDFIDKPEATTGKDNVIESFITQASVQIETFIDRKIRARTIVEYHDGKGIDTVYLDQFPIISVTSIYDSSDRSYASTDLIDSDDYMVYNDTGEVRLDSGVFGNNKQNVKATYISGWDEFVITAGVNDALDWKDDAGAEINSTLTEGTYTADELATEIDTQLTADGANAYTVTHNKNNGKFYIATDSTSVQILSYDGANVATSCAPTLGFNTDANPTASDPLISDFGVLGIPQDLVSACVQLSLYIYNDSSLGKARAGLLKSVVGGGQSTGTTTEYIRGEIPNDIKRILTPYIRRMK